MDMLIAHCRVQCISKGRRHGIQGYVWASSDAYSLFGVCMASRNKEFPSIELQTCWRVHRASMSMHLLHTAYMDATCLNNHRMLLFMGGNRSLDSEFVSICFSFGGDLVLFASICRISYIKGVDCFLSVLC